MAVKINTEIDFPEELRLHSQQPLSEAVAKHWKSISEGKEFKSAARKTKSGKVEGELYGFVNSHMLQVVAAALKEADGEAVTFNIMSPGGDFWSGTAIVNKLLSYKGEVTTINESLAASAAADIFLAGDKRGIYSTSRTMIHNIWTMALGNARDFAKISEQLAELDQSRLSKYYRPRLSKISVGQINRLLEEERLMSAAEARKWGFATFSMDDEEEMSEEEEIKTEAEKKKAEEEKKEENLLSQMLSAME